VSISFIEDTLGGGKERRCIYDEDKDVDMIVLTPEQFEAAIKEGVAQWVMNRGYMVLYDSMEDAVAKTEFYLKHDDLRKSIAQRGYEKVKAEFNYPKQLQKMFDIAGLR
jgi:aminoglycoside 6-adenylyltransferase